MARETSFRPVTLRHPDPWPPQVIEAIQQHAMACYPNESCGVVTDDEYVPCENVHPEPTKAFRIDPAITAPLIAGGTLQAVVHSHPDGPNFPSYADQEQQLAMDVIWGIVPVIGDEITATAASPVLWWGDQLPPVPLERRKFIWGIFHCFQLYRDWERERGNYVPTWPLDPNFAEQDIFNNAERVQKCGLTDIGKPAITDLEIGDLLVGKLHGPFPVHCAIYVGEDWLLHHPPGGSSGRTELVRWWPYVDKVFRRNGQASSDPSPSRKPSKKVRRKSSSRSRTVNP